MSTMTMTATATQLNHHQNSPLPDPALSFLRTGDKSRLPFVLFMLIIKRAKRIYMLLPGESTLLSSTSNFP